MTLLAAALVASVVVLWPRRRTVTGLARPGLRAVEDPPRGALSRVRHLLSREVGLVRTRRTWVAEFAELAAVGLEAGLPATESARLACAVGAESSTPGLSELGSLLAASEASGGRVGDCLRRAAVDDPELGFLAAAWRLSDEFGAAASPAARLAAGVLREREASAERRAALSAGPRASMWLLTLLPLSGPVVVLVLGLPVGTVYASGAAAGATVVGLALTALGWLWSRTILRRALRPGRMV